MKKNKNFSIKLLKESKILFAVLCSITLLSSCLKTYTDPRIDTSAHTVFVNTVPDGSSYNFYLDNFIVSNQSVAFSYALPYIYVTAGSKKVDLIPRNTTQSVASDTILFKAKNYYTIFATGQANPEFVVLEDTPADLANPPAGKSRIRLVNLSPDSPNIDLFVDGPGGTNLFTNLAYKANTAFINVEPGAYNLDFRETGTTTVKFTKHVSIEPNRVHTIFAIGVWNALPGDPSLDMGLMDAR
ncbi:MAG TPA: hypothetical protein DIT07_12095 [Sphingobacteriaceae bacterium]|nr:hypothetical protein [Sphingobacteriaceae bacterium]